MRFGEVESRGIALTPAGLDQYATALRQADDLVAESGVDTPTALRTAWSTCFPRTEADLIAAGLAAYTVEPNPDRRNDGVAPTADIKHLIDAGFLTATPIVYEDFLPRSAAGIFRSNLDSDPEVLASSGPDLYSFSGSRASSSEQRFYPHALYQQQTDRSLQRALDALGINKANA